MKRFAIHLGVMLVLAPVALAAETEGGYDVYEPVEATREWKPNPHLTDYLITRDIDQPRISVGRVQVVVRGPVVETFRRPANWSDLSPGQKFLGLPIVNLFVPQKMPRPPGAGDYFAWGESSQPWAAIATGASPGTSSDRARYHEARPVAYFAW